MKIAVILLACFVAISCQQRFMWPYTPRVRYLPNFYWNFPSADDPYAPVDSEEDGRSAVAEDRDFYPDVQGRARPQKKFGLLPANFLGGIGQPAPYVSTFTSIIFTTTTSAVITATITTCLPASHFFNPGAMSVTCARKKRQSVTVGDITEQDAHYEEEITLPDLEAIIAKKEESAPAVLVSSLDNEVASSRTQFQVRPTRALVGGNLILTSTSTVTAFSFSSTIIKKTLKVVPDPIQGVAGVLTCVPSGFIIC